MNKKPRRAQGPLLILVMLTALWWQGCAKPSLNPVLMEPTRELEPADVIVILGFGPPVDKEGKPVAEIMRRVERGVELYNRGLAPYIITTGGNTYKDYYESAVMKEVAVGMGVPPGRVIEERRAGDTIGNARYSVRIMKERGWDSCIIVTAPYHLKRANKLFLAAGAKVQAAACRAPDDPFYGPAATVYEIMARFSYLFFDEEARARGG